MNSRAGAIDQNALDYAHAWPNTAQTLGASFRASLSRHAPLYAFACFSLVLAFIADSQLEVSINYDFGLTLLSYFAKLFGAMALVIFVKRFIEFAVVGKDKAAAKKAADSILSNFSADRVHAWNDNIVNFAHFIIVFIIFAMAFNTLKPAIPLINSFSWDIYFRDLDRTLHFGRLPHEWLSFILDNSFAVFVVNVFYNLWYIAVIGSLFYAGSSLSDAYRLRFIFAFMLIWLGAGIFIATGFSSAGPCFFERLGLGTDYAPLMADLHGANTIWPIWALQTQNMLWMGHTGEIPVRLGISAFPSIHVAMTVLIALWASKQGKLIGAIAWVYAAMIMIGSVALAWHYAVDGYASVVIAVALWKISCFLIPLDKPLNAETAAAPTNA